MSFLFGPRLNTNETFQISAHSCGKRFVPEIQCIFPSIDLSDGLIAIVTMQHSKYDLVNFDPDVDQEKDVLLEKFLEIAVKFCEMMKCRGFWADYIDPCSGLSMISKETNKVYSEVYGAEILLGYRSQNAGCCKILLHPSWGAAVYPATLFTKAPIEIVTAVLESLWLNI